MELAPLGGVALEREEEWEEEVAWEQVGDQEEWRAPEPELDLVENAYVQNVEPQFPIRLECHVPRPCALIAEQPW